LQFVVFFPAVFLPEKKFAHYNFLTASHGSTFPAKPAVPCRVVYSGRKFPLAATLQLNGSKQGFTEKLYFWQNE
jgi:hypothetical protein